jgi:hypothetical protein
MARVGAEIVRRGASHWSFIADKFKAERSMSASASDLKSAYIHFTRVAVILDEIIPQHPKFDSSSLQPLNDVFPSPRKILI